MKITFFIKCLLHYSGVFEPPVSGLYLLTVYAVTTTVASGPIYIKNNDEVLCEGWVANADLDTATCSAIAELAVGDSVRVTGDSSDPSTIEDGSSGFTGHIIVGKN